MKCFRWLTTQLHRPRSNRRLCRLVFLWGLLLALAPAAHAGWTVLLNGTDITSLAAPFDRGDLPDVNVTALADSLNLRVTLDGDVIGILDVAGTQWRTRGNAITLETEMGSRSLALRSPVLKLGKSVYLPVESVAGLAGLQLISTPDTRRIMLQAPAAQSAPREDGWNDLVITKTADELTATARQSGSIVRKADSERLPPATDLLRLTVGTGYVQGADGGMQLSGVGQIGGIDVSLNSLVTVGQQGLRGQNGQLSLTDAEFGRGLDLGNLFSDLFGGMDGIRYRWRDGEDHWRSVSIYHNDLYRDGTPLMAYRDEMALGEQVRLGGEAASDGSLLLKGRYQNESLHLSAFGRWMSGKALQSGAAEIGDSAGAFAALQLGQGWQLYGGFSESQRTTGSEHWESLAVRFPLWRGTNLVVEHSRNISSQSRSTANSAMVLWPLGPFRLLTRYQWGDTDQLAGPSWVGHPYREMLATMAFAAGKRVSFDYQVSTRWGQDNTSREWAQLVSTYRVSPRTQLQVISNFPNFSDPNRLNVRLRRQVRSDLELSVEYGQLYSYQGFVEPSHNRGFMIMLRRSFDVRTPTRGGKVSGRILDEAERPVAGATVYLGQYRTVSRTDGSYRFERVPPGSYELYLDARTLPANMLSAEGRRALTIGSGTRERITLRTIPLGTIIGTVYLDTNGNGRKDPGEGVQNIALCCDTLATASRAGGAFRFDNVSPGAHTIRLVTKNLPDDLAPNCPEEVSVTLSAGGDVVTPVFRLKRREKPIIFQSLL
ncbi:MAG: carboxypeptidase regulatory-like domain-containing protein [Armatimonadota bacterium]